MGLVIVCMCVYMDMWYGLVGAWLLEYFIGAWLRVWPVLLCSHVMEELLQTEEAYVRDLKLIVEVSGLEAITQVLDTFYLCRDFVRGLCQICSQTLSKAKRRSFLETSMR